MRELARGRAGLEERSRHQGARRREEVIRLLLALAAYLSILITGGIVLSLIGEALPFFERVPVSHFLFGPRWSPLVEPRSFGVLPLLLGTLLVTLVSAAVAFPLGMGTAFFLSQHASSRWRNVLKPILEVLAGIPTVVYGYFALTFITPLLQRVLPGTEVFNALSAGIAVGIMVLPMVASLSEDAFSAVSPSILQAAYSLGATRYETSRFVLLPAALPGVVAAFLLAFSRAVGETMIVALAAGATPKLTWNPLESIQTMTGYIVQVSLGDTPAGTVEYQSIFAVGLLLFAFTLFFNYLGLRVGWRRGR